MKLTVNGRFQNQRTTGVQRYAREITSRLFEQMNVVAPRGWTSGVRGHVWEQTVLPQLTRGALLWSPCNTGPLSVAQQVVTIHDCAFVDHPEAFSRPFAAWYKWLIPRLARRARRVITVSNYSATRLAELCGIDVGKIAVIYNGVDARFRPAPADEIAALRQRLKLPERYVLSVGSIEPRKNLQRLLASWERMTPLPENIELVLAGGAMPIFRNAGIDRLPPGVHLAGYVDDADLPTLYSGATAFIYPSLYEGFGLTVLEAMACGTPVICSQTTSLPEVAGDAALQVDPLDVDQIASVTAQLLSDDALRCQLRERGLQRAAQFSWEKSAIATANVLHESSILKLIVKTVMMNPSVAIVHEWLSTYAGSERVVEQMLAVLPDAEIYSLVDFLSEQREMLGGREVRTSFIQRLPFSRKKFRGYLPLMPLAIEQFDLSQFDIVVSSHHAVAHGVLTRADQLHISYVHTPVRYAWDLTHQYLRESKLNRGLRAMIARSVLHYLRLWDRAAADRVDLFVADSHYIARRIWKTYRRKARVIYPPVDVEAFELATDKSDYYLTASRMVPYKKMDLIVEAFASMPDRKLIVAGDGPEREKIVAKAGPNIELVGYQSNDKLRELMQHARAFVFAADEDFGIMPVEVQACGTPVVAFGRGGALETVVDGQTGLFFDEQTVPSICDAIERFEAQRDFFEPAQIREHAERFGVDRFKREFSRLLDHQWQKFNNGLSAKSALQRMSISPR